MLKYETAKILIVDDNPNNLKLLAKMLRDNGYDVRAAIDGETALISVRESPPDLILLDINMPTMNGYEVAYHLKQDENTNEIPVIFISALDDTESVVTAFEHGGVDYITKPFQFAEVEARVQTHLTIALQQKLLLELRERDQERLIQISQSEARYRDLFDNAHEIIQSVDENGNFIYVNPQWHNLLGYSEDEVQQMNIMDVIHPEHRENFMQIVDNILQETKAVDFIDILFITKDKKELYVQGNMDTYEDEDTLYVRCIFRDLTEQRLAEKETVELSIERERNKVLSDFIRDSSHELRTPLSSIAQHLYMIKHLSNNEKQIEKVKLAEGKVKEVDNVIKQLHQFTTLAASRDISLENVDLKSLIQQAVVEFASVADEKQIHIDVDLKDVSYIQGDSALIKALIQELLNNALRYTSTNDEIYIRLSQPDELYILFIVRDTGIGIAPEDQMKVFDPLYKANIARTSDGSGAGIGLSIVKRIIELHDGQIQLMSQLDKGSQFNVLLPVTQV